MGEICTELDCAEPTVGRGLCSRHYQRAKYHGTLPPPGVPPRDCERCGQRFQGVRRNARYCSRQCMEQAKYEKRAPERRHFNCHHCGADLGSRDKKAQFCSDKCCTDFHNEKTKRARWEYIEANRPTCRGCDGPIPAGRKSSAEYCSDACKLASRRHQAYNLTKAELAVLLAQHEVCAICDTGDWGKKGPQVDHCHATGRVRGVLCSGCNRGLGCFADNPKSLRKAAEYLER